MKTLIFSLLLFISVNAQNIWYVDVDATTGTHDGKSWENAWQNLDSLWMDARGVNWFIIGDGDSIYVSDGVYPSQDICGSTSLDNGIPGITFDEQVVIAPAWQTGHTGDVIFRNTDEADVYNFRFVRLSNIKLTGFTFEQITTYDAETPTSSNIAILEDSLVVFDNCTMTNGGTGSAFGWMSSTKDTVQNCTIQTLHNTNSIGQDVFVWMLGKGGHMIKNNTIIQRGRYEGTFSDGTNMTATDTSLTDTDMNMVTDYHVGATIHVGSNYMYVEHNTATTFYGTYVGDYSWTNGVNSKSGFESVTTDTSLTNSGLSLVTNAHIGEMITVINGSPNASRMIVTSNNTTTFYGTWIEGGAPIQGQVWTCRVTNIDPSDGSAWWVESTAHKDMIQFSEYQNTTDELLTTTFDGNFIWAISPNATAWNSGIYTDASAAYDQRYVFVNNILVIDVKYTMDLDITLPGSVPGLNANTIDKEDANIYWTIYNNTFITPAPSIGIYCADSIIVKNNIFISTQPLIDAQGLTVGYDVDFDNIYKDFDYNHYYIADWDSDDKYLGAGSGETHVYNWGEWQGLAGTLGFIGSDVNSDSGYISLVDVRDSVISAYMPTEQLQGTDLSAYGITTDILGNPRTVWTIGALEFDDATDTIPTFSFTPVTGATRSQTYTATSVFTAVDSTFHVSTTTGASFKVGVLSNYATTMVEADSGDTVYVQNTASGSYETPNRETIVAGGYARNFDVTTGSAPVAGTKKTFRLSNGQILKDSSGKIIRTAE